MRRLFTLLTLALLTVLNIGSAEKLNLARNTASTNSTDQCSYTFTTGSGQRYLQTCVTVNGNVVEFQNPLGIEDIRNGIFGEGYGMCDSGTNYYDFAAYGDSGNWQAPVTLSSTATSVKIARSTTDGIWTLTQLIVQDTGNARLKVSMTLHNNTSSKREILLIRWVDADADNSLNNNFDATATSGFAWNTGGFGLFMQNRPPWTYLSGVGIDDNVPKPCSLNGITLTGPVFGDYAIYLAYVIPIPAGASRTVGLTYQGM